MAEQSNHRQSNVAVGRLCQGCETLLPPSNGPRARKWCSDSCRKRTLYSGTCVDCGGATDPSNGRANAATRCRNCHNAYRTKWTPEAIVDAIRRWNDAHGRPPGAREWNTTLARKAGLPFRGHEYPGTDTVQTAFGSWNAAIEAAGFEPLPRGIYRSRRVAA